MFGSGKTHPESRLCCVVSKGAGDDPAGSGTSFDGYLGIEVAPPWREDVAQSRHFPEGLWEAVERAWDGGAIGKFTGLMPDPEYSREGYTRAMFLRKPDGPFAAYEKKDYVVPDDEIVPLVEALSEGPEGLSRFGRYGEDASHVRDILVCTHGSNDVCCGKFGYPVYEILRHKYADASGGRLRVWRTSHIGGHRFAPTLMDFPEGRYWGHLEPEALENFVLRNGPVSELRRFYRGWAGIGRVEQIAEREIFVREGWGWTEYLKSGRVLEMDEENDRAEVRIDYESPDGSVSGAYEATVEPSGSVLTLASSGIDPLKEARQYRVSQLKKVPWRR